MKKIKSLKDVRQMPDSVVKRALEARAELCHGGDYEVLAEMEEEFNGPLGGDWYQFEEGDDPQHFHFEEDGTVDLLSDEWNWCDEATLENGCYFIFWGSSVPTLISQ